MGLAFAARSGLPDPVDDFEHNYRPGETLVTHKIGTIQRRLALPLHKDDTLPQRRMAFEPHYFLVSEASFGTRRFFGDSFGFFPVLTLFSLPSCDLKCCLNSYDQFGRAGSGVEEWWKGYSEMRRVRPFLFPLLRFHFTLVWEV